MIASPDICDRLYALARERNGENVSLLLNEVPVLVVQRHEDAEHVLLTHARRYRKNMAWFRQAVGPSRFTEEGEGWLRRRALTHRHFTQFDRDRTCRVASQQARHALHGLIADSAAGTMVIDDARLRRMAVAVLLESFFQLPIEAVDIDLQNIADLMALGSACAFIAPGQVAGAQRELLRALPAIHRRVLADFRVFRSGEVPRSALLDDLLAADRDPGSGIVLEQELLTFFAAGAETVATTLGWACHLLATHPALQSALAARAQARDAAAAGEGGEGSEGSEGSEGAGDWTPGWGGLAEDAMLAAFLSETLRRFPATPIVGRIALEADSLGPTPVAAGDNILISFIGIQHDARWHRDPWCLDVDGGNRLKGPGSGAGSAFSSGPRVCGGRQFAWIELTALIHRFVADAVFVSTSDEAPDFLWKSQMLRAGGQRVRVLAREQPRDEVRLPGTHSRLPRSCQT